MTSFKHVSKLCATIILAGLAAGCAVEKEEPAPAPAAAPAAAPAEKPGYFWMALPTGAKETSALLIERTAPTAVSLNAPFSYEVKVTNLTNTTLNDVVVSDTTDANFVVAKAEPAPTTSSGNKHTWNLGNIPAGQSKTIVITGSANKPVALKDCLEATWNSRLCSDVAVVEPKLALTSVAPAQVLSCDPIPVAFTVTNTGSGVARNVKLDVPLTNLNSDKAGEKALAIPVGDIAPGASKTINVSLKAAASGTAATASTASADGNLKVSSSTSTKVVKPNLAITKKGLDVSLLGRDVSYSIVVTNKGDGEARDVIVEDTLPVGTTLKSNTAGGAISQNKDKITWAAGTLAPGASKEYSVVVSPSKIAKIDNSATARAYCNNAVSDNVTTDVRGIPAILLEVVDENDPVLVGENVTYTITATNQGSAVGTNIKIVATLEGAMEFVKADGATAATAAGNTITFAPVQALAAGAKAKWNVVVKAKNSGDVRFKITMTSDQISRPVEETEATNFYK